MYEITRGVSVHYEHDGKPIPERGGECVDEMRAQVAKARGAQEKCHAHRVHFWHLGNVMGDAAWQEGVRAGQGFMEPQDGKIWSARGRALRNRRPRRTLPHLMP